MRKHLLLILSLMLVSMGFSQTKATGVEKGMRADGDCIDVYSEFDASACHSYIWNGVTYTESGDYVQTFPIGGEYKETYFYDFDNNTNEDFIGWQWLDLDGDGNKWGIYYGTNPSAPIGHNSNYILASYSYLNDTGEALSPDNIVILPYAHMRSDSKFSFWVREATASNADVFAVYAVTSLNYTTLNDFIQLGGDITVSSTTWTQYTFDLGAFAGQSIGIAFRHYNCTDQHGVWIDDVELYRSDRSHAVSFDENIANGVSMERDQLAVAEDERSQNVFVATSFEDLNRQIVPTRELCDSIVTMHLTILGGPTYEFNATACNSYTWNGVVYTESGDYMQSFDVVNGEVGGEEVLFYYDFDHLPLSYAGWQIFDVDGDGNNWGIYTGNNLGHNSTDVMASFSYVNQVDISPDNFIVLPYAPISHNTKLSFWAREMAPGWPDAFGVFVTTATEITSTDDFVQIGSDIIVNGGTWVQYTFDLSAFAGQTVGIAFRHYNTYGGWAVLIDDIELYNGSHRRPMALGLDNINANIVRGERDQQFVAIDQNIPSSQLPYGFGNPNMTRVPVREICDSLVTMHLTITGGPTHEFDATACGSYTWNDVTYYETGDYVQVFDVEIENDGDEVIYHYSFDDETEDLSELQILSADGDDYNWGFYSVDGLGHNSSNFLASFSYDSETETDLTPDNFVVLPYTTISANTKLCFWARQLTYGWPDVLGVYVTTATEITSTADFEQLGNDLIVYDSTYRRYMFNLGAYAGQTVAIALRHYNCSGAYAVMVDDIVLFNGSSRGSVADNNELPELVRAERNRQLVASNVLPQSGHIASVLGHANIAKAPVIEICDSTVTLHLTINPILYGDYYRTICDTELPYEWLDATFTEGGEQTVTLTGATADGCDSIVTLHLTVNYSATKDVNETACDTYTWTTGNGETYTESGDYEWTTTTAAGCDSIVTLHLTVNYSATGDVNETACDSYTWTTGNGETYTASGDYEWTTTTAAGCDSIVTLHLTVNYSATDDVFETACDTYTWTTGNGETYTESGDYDWNTTTEDGCPLVVTLHLTVNYSATGDVNETVCDTYTWATGNGETYTESGDYEWTTTTVAGCDSIVTLHLTVNYSATDDVYETVCDSYTWATGNGETYTESGDYVWNTTTEDGCPLAVTLHLTVNYSATDDVYETACDTYTWTSGNGETYTESGDYVWNTTTEDGCPLAVTLHLTVNYSATDDVYETVCDTYTWTSGNGETYTESGDYVWNTTTEDGCPLAVTLHLTVNYSATDDVFETVCDSYTWTSGNGETYSVSGDYEWNTTTEEGCPLLVTLHLTINDSGTDDMYETACDTYTWTSGNGETYTESGDYVWNTTTTDGCPLAVTLHLTVNYSATDDVYETVCDTYTWTSGNGETYTESGDYVWNTTTEDGCPLAVTLHLTVNYSDTEDVYETVCDTYTWTSGNGETYSESGDYEWNTTTTDGCPMLVTLHLTVNNSGTDDVYETACDSYTWTSGNGETYTESGDYVWNTTTTDGCPLAVTLHLTVNYSDTEDVYETVCDSYTWTSGNGETYTESGNYVWNTTTTDGCPLAVTLHLTVNYSDTEDVYETVCDSYTWTSGNGETYTESGNYVWNTTTEDGCPLAVTLHLTVNNSGTDDVYETACDSYTWTSGNGETYTESGDYVWNTTTTDGCPLAVTLHLTVNYSATDDVYETVCDSYTWTSGNGETYTESGNYVWNTTTTDGCPLAVTLHLTVNYSDTEDVYETVCDSYTWTSGNGETYTESGNYVWNTTTEDGCPLTVTLHLTVNNSGTDDVYETVCDSYTWTSGNGETYTESGNYVWNTTTEDGCPLAVTLHLTVNNSGTDDVYETVCDSYTWTSGNGETYTESGNYVWNTTTTDGCPLAVTLHLTVNYSDTEDVYETVCDSYTWTSGNGETYTESGNYVWNTTTTDGCPLAVTLHLTVNYSDTEDVYETVCDSYTWTSGNGETYTESGNYVWNTTTTDGCPLAVTLHLTVNNGGTEDVYETVCDTYTWTSGNGETYTESGDYVWNTTTADGCPLAVTLHLTVNPTLTGDYFVGICETELPFEWHGMTFEEGGDYPVTLEGVTEQGCDSIVILKLSIYESPEVAITGDTLIALGSETTLTASGADTYVWSTGETTESITVSPTAESTTYTVVGTSAEGCSSTAEITVHTIDGVIANVFSISIYPNPVRNVVTVESEGIQNVRVVDMIGQTLYDSNESSDTVRIDLSSFASGVYFVEVKTVNGIATHKVVLEK